MKVIGRSDDRASSLKNISGKRDLTGLVQGIGKLGHRAISRLREPRIGNALP
jgi:hypothetical protein